MKERLEGYIKEALKELGITGAAFTLEHPADMAHGDWATNVAMAAFAKAKKIVAGSLNTVARNMGFGWRGDTPHGVAEYIRDFIDKKNDPDILSVSIAGPGFINIKLSDDSFTREIGRILDIVNRGGEYARHDRYKANTILFEYTDPNPFKMFHVGHFLPNAIGESFARLSEFSGAKVFRMTYGGDVGPHVAKTLWGLEKLRRVEPTLVITPAVLGRAYVDGNRAYEEDTNAKKEITELNKQLYDKTEREANTDYVEGKRISVEHFHALYAMLGTKFDDEVFESEVAPQGMADVRAALGTVFKESDGAVVYEGDEAKGLHTRVFITKEGTPTYEAKEVGLTELKFKKYPDLKYSVVVTGNEQNDYFKVVFAALQELHPEYKGKLYQTGHGMLRFASGKMSSRLGNVLSGAEFLSELAKEIAAKHPKEIEMDMTPIAVAAVKFAILRQAIGKDIIFDAEQSISVEGDSGPYLQYTHARLHSLLEKGEAAGKKPMVSGAQLPPGTLERLIVRFPSVVFRAQTEQAPQYIASYLIEVAREFNAFYARTQIIDETPECGYKLALVIATKQVIKEGLWLLGIVAPDKM